jgi:hypothetical protein
MPPGKADVELSSIVSGLKLSMIYYRDDLVGDHTPVEEQCTSWVNPAEDILSLYALGSSIE